MSKKVSFSRHIEVCWLDQVAEWVACGYNNQQLNRLTEELLEPSINCKVNRGKTRNQLIKLWSSDSENISQSFYDFAVESIRKTDKSSFVLHWGLLVAKNNFFVDVVRFIGRRHKHSDSFTYSQIQKHIVELYGETETVKRSLRSVLKTLVNFHILNRESNRSYQAQKLHHQVEAKYKSWLLQSLMYNQNFRSRALTDLLDDQIWFPFDFSVTVNELDTAWFDLHQQGNDIVLFRK